MEVEREGGESRWRWRVEGGQWRDYILLFSDGRKKSIFIQHITSGRQEML